MKKSGKQHLTYEQRLQLAHYLQMNVHKTVIADRLNCHISTIYREIERGTINGIYDPDYSQQKQNQFLKLKGQREILRTNDTLAQKIANYILNENLSIEDIIKKLKQQHIDCPSRNTIYTAIDKGIIPNVTRENLHNKTTIMFSHGLIQIPKWMRNRLELRDGDILSISLQNNKIILEKH